MSSVLKMIQNLPQATKGSNNVATDINYIRKSSVLVNEALQKGSDIMQMSNGDIIITEVKTVTYKYTWNNEKHKFERASSGSKIKRKKRAPIAVPRLKEA